MTYRYPIVIVKEKAAYWCYIPDMPGVYGRGRSESAAKKDLQAALKLYVEDCKTDGDDVPASNVRSVKIDHINLAA